MKKLFSSTRLLLLLFFSNCIHATPLTLTEIAEESLGKHTYFLVEDGARLTLSEAILRRTQHEYQKGEQAALSFGIGSPPVWLHLSINNPADTTLSFRLTLGTTWIDQLDIAIFDERQHMSQWHTGDAQPATHEMIPAKGFSMTHAFPPGNSDIYIRAETVDPLLLPITLTHIDNNRTTDQWSQYAYGFMYGYLCALIAYNMMLYAGLRKRSYLYYLLYLSSFILTNLAYTGHGFAWLWPESPLIQRYIILVLMVLYSCCGLIFAVRFLSLRQLAPRLIRWIRGYIILGPCLISLAVLFDAHLFAVIIAFSVMTLFTLIMVLLGSLALWRQQAVAGYFLSAALFGMLGAAITTLAVLGWIPFTPLTYHSVDFGILIEATLLAMALTHQVRKQQNAQTRAEYMARHDSLTGLLNRRGFHDFAHNIWSHAVRKQRTLSIIMLDIDYFKQVNDKFGHTVGDQVLIDISQLLTAKCRAGDLLARWGGEEFIILLPETELEQAHVIAERIRIAIERSSSIFKQNIITTTASLGVAEHTLNHTLNELINEADKRLYQAKKLGRNQTYTAK